MAILGERRADRQQLILEALHLYVDTAAVDMLVPYEQEMYKITVVLPKVSLHPRHHSQHSSFLELLH